MFELVSQISFYAPDIRVIIAIIFTLLLLFMSGFASGSEIAFFSLSPSDLKDIEESNSTKDKNINILREDSERTLATILITNNLVNVTIIMLCNYICHSIIDFAGSQLLEFVFLTVFLTFILLLFGEIIPKVFARQSPLSFCRMTVSGVMLLRKLFWSMESLLMKTSLIAEKVMNDKAHMLSTDELEQALEMTDEDDILAEKSMLEGILRFSDESVKEIMTSRNDITFLNFKERFPEVLSCIVANNYSRIPVFQENTDNVKGILYIKDLLPHLNKPEDFRWQSLIRAPYFVPETKKIDNLMREFQENKIHIAIVVDEFGGTSGLVTMEDILEEIVGEINDEYDEEKKFYTRLNKNTYLFEGKTLLSDMQKVLNFEDDFFEDVQGEADTLAGLLLEINGDFPKIKDKFVVKNYRFEILEVEERRINKVKVIVE